MVTATVVPIPINHGARTAMLQPSAPFPPAKPNKREVGGGCGCCEMVGGGGCNMVDCPCAGPREYAMIEGQRFYLSIDTGGTPLQVPWAGLFEPLTDVVVAIDGVFVGIDSRLGGGALSLTAPNKQKALEYVVSILFQAVAKRRRAGTSTSGSVPIVVLRRTGVGEAAYVTVEAPVRADMDALRAADTSDCPSCPSCAGPLMGTSIGKIFRLVAYSAEVWACQNSMVVVGAASGALAEGDVLLAVNGRPVDGDAELATALLEHAGDGAHALVKRGGSRPTARPKFERGGAGWTHSAPFEGAGCWCCAQTADQVAQSLAPNGWYSVSRVPIPPDARVALSARAYSIGGLPRVGFGAAQLAGKFAASAGYWMCERMRGEFTTLDADDDPTGDQLRFSGCKLYGDVWCISDGNNGVILPCPCLPFPLCYTYTRSHGGNRFDPAVHVLPCYGPWYGTFHAMCCTESGTFSDADTFESACGCCGRMTRR